ncbi:MAG: LacI family transcriptional regulator [Patescibacteria group bacterium]|jgi:LacI family transcriptional regulator
MKRITIKDLAKLLSLSTSTLSRDLSDHPDISEATKSRVRIAATEFNYTTNLHASLFRKNRSGLIALILPKISLFFSPGFIDGINEVVASYKHSLIVFLSNNSHAREKEIVQQCLRWAVEGGIDFDVKRNDRFKSQS